jgi:mannose-6-phosphate isomerase-like protein (cupin superfamily)
MSTRRTMLMLSMTCALALPNFGTSAQDASNEQTQPLAVNLDEVNWGPPGGGNGFPVGVRTERQGIDPVTGGITYYALFPAGSHFDLHWHTHDEFVAVVRGPVVIELGGKIHTMEAGGYIVIPGKMNHSWDVPAGGEDAVILVRRAGPADFQFAEQ